MQLFEKWQSATIEKGFIYLKPKFFLEKEKELIERILK